MTPFAFAGSTIYNAPDGILTGAQMNADPTLATPLDDNTHDYYATLAAWLDWIELQNMTFTGILDFSGATVTFGLEAGDIPDISATYVTIASINTAAELETIANLGAYASDILGCADQAALGALIPTLNQNTSGTAANLSGTPALPNGVTATTQSQADNSTKLATTAYVDTLGGTKATISGIPAQYEWGVFASATAIEGVAVTASKGVMTDANGKPAPVGSITLPLASTYGYQGNGSGIAAPVSPATFLATLKTANGDVAYTDYFSSTNFNSTIDGSPTGEIRYQIVDKRCSVDIHISGVKNAATKYFTFTLPVAQTTGRSNAMTQSTLRKAIAGTYQVETAMIWMDAGATTVRVYRDPAGGSGTDWADDVALIVNGSFAYETD